MPESVMDPSYASGSRFNPNGIQMKLQHPTPPRIEGNIEKIGTSHDDVFQYRKSQSSQIPAKKNFKFWFSSFCSWGIPKSIKHVQKSFIEKPI